MQSPGLEKSGRDQSGALFKCFPELFVKLQKLVQYSDSNLLNAGFIAGVLSAGDLVTGFSATR